MLTSVLGNQSGTGAPSSHRLQVFSWVAFKNHFDVSLSDVQTAKVSDFAIDSVLTGLDYTLVKPM